MCEELRRRLAEIQQMAPVCEDRMGRVGVVGIRAPGVRAREDKAHGIGAREVRPPGVNHQGVRVPGDMALGLRARGVGAAGDKELGRRGVVAARMTSDDSMMATSTTSRGSRTAHGKISPH